MRFIQNRKLEMFILLSPCIHIAADYKEWDVEPHQSCGPQYKYRRPSTEFGGDPIYTTDYIDHGLVKPLGACRPVAQPIQSGPFSGITTFTADYVPKQGG